jgi:hypothetical protein
MGKERGFRRAQSSCHRKEGAQKLSMDTALRLSSPIPILLPPRHIGRQQTLEQPAMIGHAQVQQSVDDDEIAESALTSQQAGIIRQPSTRGARRLFAPHRTEMHFWWAVRYRFGPLLHTRARKPASVQVWRLGRRFEGCRFSTLTGAPISSAPRPPRTKRARRRGAEALCKVWP